MPIPLTLPVISDTPADLIIGRRCILAILPTSGTQKNFMVKFAGFSRTVERTEHKGIDASNNLIVDDEQPGVIKNGFKCTIEHVTEDFVTTFLNNVEVRGTARLFVLKPGEAAGKVTLVTNEFAATCYADGEMGLDRENYLNSTINVTAKELIQWTRSATLV